MRETLEASLAVHSGRPQLEPTDEPGVWRLLHPDLPGWVEVIDESLRTDGRSGGRGSLRRLAFDSAPFVKAFGERLVFSPRPDVALTHLSHPMLDRAFSALARARFPGAGEEASRWMVRVGDLRGLGDAVDAVVLLSVEEIGVNELRETFHHWVRTVAFPVKDGVLGGSLEHRAASTLRGASPTSDPALIVRATGIFEDVLPDLKVFVTRHQEALTGTLRAELEAAGEAAKAEEDRRYASRAGEVSTLIAENTLAKLEREIATLRAEQAQGTLFDQEARLDDLARSIEEKQAEVERRRRHYEEVRQQLERERERITKHLLPKRHALAGTAHVFPVCVEIRLPGGRVCGVGSNGGPE
jgi:hypothetical protein